MRLSDLIELVRVPNVFTAPADVAMGLAVSGAALDKRALALCAASACAYAGGMALNDACDAALDARERPARPIPSGRVSRRAAFAVAGALLAAALALAALAGLPSLATALSLVGAIVLYDAVAKRGPAGPPVMAACRALDVGLGLSLGAVGVATLAPAVLLFGYVLVLTRVSRFEVSAAPAAVVDGAIVAWGAIFFASAIVMWWRWPEGLLPGALVLAALIAWLARPLARALAAPEPRHVIGVIKAAVLGIIFFDAAFTAAAAGLLAGAAVVLLFAPAYALGRRFASA
jgi:4-hydroxybenzoate polyprenyltransferase